MSKKKGLLYGTEIFYTKKALNNFIKSLKRRKVSYSTRKVSAGYQIQWYKKLRRK